MSKYFIYAFGVDGDTAAIPDATDPGGAVSYEQGWTPPYQGDYPIDTSALPIPRNQMNQLMYDITSGIQQYQQFGVPAFILASQNGGSAFPYGLYARVGYDDGSGYKVYESNITNNTNTPGTGSAYWNIISGQSGSLPSGAFMDFGGTTVPAGFLLRNGAAISRTTYSALFAAIGTTWGAGDGSTTFNLPNSARRVSVGSGGTATSELNNTVGSIGGEEAHTLTTAELSPHAHSTFIQYFTGNYVASGGGAQGNFVNLSGSGFSPTSSTEGSGTPFNVMQPSQVILPCIKI